MAETDAMRDLAAAEGDAFALDDRERRKAQADRSGTVPNLAFGQRLHLVLGAPATAALQAWMLSLNRPTWVMPERWNAGDLFLTVLDTTPRMLLCLEEAGSKGSHRSKQVHVSDLVIDFAANAPEPLIPVPSVMNRIGRSLPRPPATLPDKLANDLLDAINAEILSPTPYAFIEGKRTSSTARQRSSGLRARLIAERGAVCDGCETDYSKVMGGLGVAALEVDHIPELATRPGEIATVLSDVALLCGTCHNIRTFAEPQPTLDEVRKGMRDPRG